MKRILGALTLAALAASANAQIQTITTSRNAGGLYGSSFSIGPRISSYSTDLDAGFTSLKTGRQSSFGIMGDYRTGALVIDFMADHDPENGIGITGLIFDIGQFERDRGEVTVGFAATSFLDLQGGIRLDQIRVGGASFFGNDFLSDLNIDHQAITGGLRVHTGEESQVGWYGLARGYIGSADFDVEGVGVNSDSSGFRGETGLLIRLGQSNWSLVPAFEYEHLETNDYDINLDTNRFLLSFVYRRR